jgi:uncharacterized protein YndB with AHSA1/START domain
MTTYQESTPQLHHRRIAAGEARVAVFTRTYSTTVQDLWDACTQPKRLGRWYTAVSGELRVGGTFHQQNMGSGTVEVCEAPHRLKLSLGGGADEIEVTVSAGPDSGTATLEVQHATTFSEHEIGGQMFDAIYCMGGGYYPRLEALDQHLRGTLPEEYDATAFHLNPAMRPSIDRGSAAMTALLQADARSANDQHHI